MTAFSRFKAVANHASAAFLLLTQCIICASFRHEFRTMPEFSSIGTNFWWRIATKE
jgi:hypothetical protein